MTKEEYEQLKEMTRPTHQGRLATHELLAKIVLEQQEEIHDLKESLIRLIHKDAQLINSLVATTESLIKASTPSANPTSSPGN